MAITEEGYYVCDYCAEDDVMFNDDTGNHLVCEENIALREQNAELTENIRLANEALYLLAMWCRQGQKGNIGDHEVYAPQLNTDYIDDIIAQHEQRMTAKG